MIYQEAKQILDTLQTELELARDDSPSADYDVSQNILKALIKRINRAKGLNEEKLMEWLPTIMENMESDLEEMAKRA